MKAAVLTGLSQLEIRDLPDPVIERGHDVLLKVEAVGVCGSDVHYYTLGRIGSQVVRYPYRIGHECAASVAAVGHEVKRVKPGDRVAVEPAVSCGKCDQCLNGRRHTCRSLQFLGTPGQGEGCLCEYIVMPGESCFPIKPETTFEQAALVEPLSIGVYSVRLCGPVNGANVAVLGCGPIGLSVMLSAMAGGAEKVYATDRIDGRVETARSAGACWGGNPDAQDVVGAIGDIEPRLLDIVWECCGQQEALDQASNLLKPGGTLVIVGIPEVDRVSFSMDILRRREIRVLNVRRQNECVQAALDLIENDDLDVDFMVTHRFPLNSAKDALDLAASYRDNVIKAMVLP